MTYLRPDTAVGVILASDFHDLMLRVSLNMPGLVLSCRSFWIINDN